MYKQEMIAMMMKVAVLWKLLDRADLMDEEQVETLAEQAHDVKMMAGALSDKFMGLAHFLEEVRR